MIEDTSKTHGILDLPVFGGSGDAILGMEARGQQQLVNSDRLPTDTRGADAEFLALGFTFGEPDVDDPLFRPATLPPGWSRKPTDHSMWSKLVDEFGRERVTVFYKAAFYDRRAFMRLATPQSYASALLYDESTPVFDDAWFTPEVADAELVKIRDYYATEAREFDEYAAERRRTDGNREELHRVADERRASAAKAEAFRVRVAAEAAK